MGADFTDPKSIPTESSLMARVRMLVEKNREEVGFGDRIVLQTDQNIYGFFQIFDDKYPYLGIKSPLDSNPYDSRDQSVIVTYVSDIARDYILETTQPGVLDLNATLELISMDEHQISLKEADRAKYYEVLSTGEVCTHSDPRESTPIQEIPEPD